ncbi:hypothetical protein SAMN05892877_14121 [Rhizobium subbaraonis]|uniref:Uncharacterized protein n=1 Tax=Rhizobium subbaraonis TaxID=908946 RepID=A0A285V2L2_9HYPH|nr:hypothetical protein [Rhizobium subbaraonis]SOC48177.1 hypothetical protein SAMN05892877_14121 [Rhizobium subbaraonis]
MQFTLNMIQPRFKAATVGAVALLLAACSGSGIDGKYRDPKGNTVNFLEDGTAVFVINGTQAIWKWATYDGNRLKLEPGPGVLGVSAAVCDYKLDGSSLRVTGCDYAMQLTRV